MLGRPTVRLRHPRLFGLFLLVLGAVINAYNWLELTRSHRFWVSGILIGPSVMLLGALRLVFGQPWNEAANRMQRWVLVLDGIAACIGLSISGVILYRLYYGDGM
jgi:hypothetical protein